MVMRIVPDTGERITIAIIDPRKNYGEPGQYTKHTGNFVEIARLAEEAKCVGMEVRWYYQGIKTADSEAVGSQTIITWIPPGHVQPFHTHHQIHEYTVVMEGVIVAIDSPVLTERDCRVMSVDELLTVGARFVHQGHMVVEGPGTRHTVMNKSEAPALLVTIQTARMPIDSFPGDWSADKPSNP